MKNAAVSCCLAMAVGLAALLTRPDTALAQSSAPDVRSMVESVRSTADALNQTLAQMPERLRDTVRSADDALNQLDQMKASAQQVVDTLAEDGQFWLEFRDLQSFADSRKELASNRLGQTGEERWRQRVVAWEAQRGKLRDIEREIIQERARAVRQLQRIDRDSDYIVDSMVLGEVEEAVTELEKARQQLVAMNEGVEGILTSLSDLPNARISQ